MKSYGSGEPFERIAMDITGLVKIVAYVANNTMIVKLSNMPLLREETAQLYPWLFVEMAHNFRKTSIKIDSCASGFCVPRKCHNTTHNLVQIVAYVANNTIIVKLSNMPLPREDPGVRPRRCPPYPQRDRKKATKWGGVSESPYKKDGPVSVLGRVRVRTLRNFYGVKSPIVGPTSFSVRLHIYVPSHI